MKLKVHSDKVKCFSLFRRISFLSIEDGLLLLAGMVIVFLMLLTTADVTGRYVFIHPVRGAVEISEVLLCFMVFLSLSATQRTGDHISMDAIVELLRRKKKAGAYHLLESFNLFVPLLIFALGAYLFFKETSVCYALREASWGPLYIKYWPSKLCIAIAFTILCIRFGIQLTKHLRCIGRESESKA